MNSGEGKIENQNYYRLKRVLQTFVNYDHSIGYMQGMNFIMAAIMYHCNEEVAFWIFVQLMALNDQVRTIYQPPNMPGLQYHVKILEKLIEKQFPEFNDFLLNDLNLSTHQIYLHDWIIPLFTSIMPIDLIIDYLIEFFAQGWTYFYKISLCIIKVLSPYIINNYELDQILSILKFREIPLKQHRRTTLKVNTKRFELDAVAEARVEV